VVFGRGPLDIVTVGLVSVGWSLEHLDFLSNLYVSALLPYLDIEKKVCVNKKN